jgi:hypothetical protein
MKFVLPLLLSVVSATCATVATAADVTRVPAVIVFNDTAFSWPVGDRSKFKAGDAIWTWDVVEAKRNQTLVSADCARWSLTVNGAKWCFASEENLAAFKKATDEDGNNSFIPKFGGRCLLGTSWGVPAAPGDPRTFRLIDGELVLQSHNKWWPEYNRERALHEKLATLSMRIYRAVGVVDDNAKLAASKGVARK